MAKGTERSLTSFITLLRNRRKRQGVEFFLTGAGCIRTVSTGVENHCPLSYCVKGAMPCSYVAPAEKLRISANLREQIVDAADNSGQARVNPVVRDIRQRLLRATGIVTESKRSRLLRKQTLEGA
jgi:hypothetical protein